MGRLRPDFIERAETFSHRVVDVADALASDRRSSRVVDQLIGAGTSVSANLCESDEALSRADFCKHVGISLKELSETRFWLRFASKRSWIPASRLDPLPIEAAEIRLILGSILNKSRVNKVRKKTVPN